MLSALRRRASLLTPVVVAALLAAAAPAASAQCFGPDGLGGGPCCSPALPNLPPFPAASLPGLGICWTQCTPTSSLPLKVGWTAPTSPLCSSFSAQINVADGSSGAPLMTGKLILDYTRTWTEIDPSSGSATQVWRFTAKADMTNLSLGTPPCVIPNCILPGGFNTSFWYGYVDYTGCTAAGPFSNVLVLYHAADRFIHMGGLSSTPGAFHPTKAFAIVAPSSAIQPFVPGNIIAPFGPVIGDGQRDGLLPGTIVCEHTDPVLVSSIVKLGAGCVNTLSLLPKQQTLRQFTGTTTCVNTAGLNGGWQSLNVSFPILPWSNMVTTSIGKWSNPNVYPGNEIAFVDEGLFIHQSACSGDFVEIKYGGSTQGGWTAITSSGPMTNFTDIADNYTAPLLGPYPTPIVGNIMTTDHLIYVNMP